MANGWTVVGKVGGSGDENKSDKGWTVVGKVSNTAENQIDPSTTYQPIKFGTGGRVINSADKDFKNFAKITAERDKQINDYAENYAKEQTKGDGYESYSLKELEKLYTDKKADYDAFYVGSNDFQTAINKIGFQNVHEDDYKRVKEAYENRLAAKTIFEKCSQYNVDNIDSVIELLEKKKKTAPSKEVKEEIETEIKQIRKNTYGKGNVFKYVGKNVIAGMTAANKSFTATADFLVGNLFKAFGWKNNPISKFNEYIGDNLEYYSASAVEEGKKLGFDNVLGDLTSNVIRGSVSALPQVVLAMYTGGSSTLANVGIGGVSATNTTASTVANFLSSSAKNPLFWTSVTSELGSNYEEALANGANETEATLFATLTSTLNAFVEIGGGIETLPGNLQDAIGNKNKLWQWFKSALEEGGEEVVQSIISNINAKLVYDHNKEIASLENEDAVINPKRLSNEFITGSAVGGLLGGGQLTYTNIINAKTESQFKKIGKTIKFSNSDSISGLIDYAKKSLSPEIRGLAKSVNVDKIKDADLGRIYSYACRDIDLSVNSPKELTVVFDNFTDIVESSDNKLINGIATSRLFERLTNAGIDEASANYMIDSMNVNNAKSNIDTESEKSDVGVTVADLQSSANNAVTDNTVFHDPKITDIAEELDANDKYVTKDNRYKFKDSRQKHIERVANKLGAKITWSEDVKRGKYIPSERRIVLNPNIKTSEMYNFVFKHEFTHYLEGKIGYTDFKNYVFEKSAFFEKWVRERLAENGIDSNGSREAIIKRLTQVQYEAYRNSDELSKVMRDRFSMNDAEAEVLADFVGENLLGTGDRLEQTLYELGTLEKKHRGIIQRIRDFISDLIARYRNEKRFGGLVKDLEYLNDRLKRVAESSDKKISDIETEKYSIAKSFEEQIDDVINGTHNPRLDLYVSETPEYLINLNFSDSPILMRNSKISDILNKHSDMSAEVIKQIPKAINNPLLVLKSKTHPQDSVVIITDIKTANGDMIIPVWANQSGNYIDIDLGDISLNTNFVASAYGRNTASLIEYAANNDGILYQNPDMEKVSQLLARNGLQLPTPLKLSDSDITVPQKAQSVNTSISENSKNDTEKSSIAVLPADELLDKYDRGEITREEYLKRTDTMTRRAALQYVQEWERENGTILSSQKRLEAEREKAVELEREEQQMRKDRESNIGAIRRTVRKLDHALRANTNAKHIPEAYKNVVSGFCKLFVDNDKATFEHKELADIYSYYSSLKGDENNADTPQYDPYIDELLKGLIDTLTGKKLTDLNNLELNYLRTITDALNFIVDHEAQIFIDGKKAKYDEVGRAALTDIESAEPVKLFGALKKESAEKIRKFFYEGNMLPEYFLKRIGGTFEKAFRGLADGQNKWAQNMEISRKFVEDIKSKYDYDEWKDTTVSFITESGVNVEITIDQAMQLVATAQRERSNNGQKAKHLSIGGVVIDTEAINKAMKKQGKSKEDISAAWDSLSNRAIQITFEDVDSVSKILTDAQKGYIKDFVDFLSTQCAVWGNEVTMEQYGYRQFNESNYFPYVSSELFLNKDPAKAESTILRRASFTHSLQKNANNPLILTSFTDIALQHIESMCNFNAMTVPLETINKIFNYKTESNEDVAPRSVKAEMKNVFGSGAVDYIENLINDLNKGVRGDQRDSFLNKTISLFKKNAVLANLSVIFQQPTAIIRAGSDMEWKYFAKASKYFSKNIYEECKRYAPVAVIKQMGRFDTGIGVKNTTWLSGEQTFKEKADDFLGWGAGKADEIAWSYLWSAVKAEIADTTDLKVGSEEFLTKAGKRFTELVNKTQVYDSVLTKSQNMRNKGLVGSITSFMSEPTVALNMLVNSFLDFTEDKISGKKFARVIAAVATAEIATAMMQSIITAARDDEEDKSYLEKYLKNVVSNSLSNFNLAGKIPYIRDIMSLWDGYDIERQDISAVSDLIEAFQTLTNDNKTVPEKMRRISEALSALFGVPLKNIDRDIEAIAKTIYGFAFGKEKTDVYGVKVSMLEGISENNILKPLGVEFFDFSKTGEYERMAKAAKRGDEKTYSESYNRLVKNGAEDSEIRTGIRNEFKSDKTVKKQAANYNKELKQSDTFNSFSDDDKKKLTGQVTSALAKEAMIKATEREPDEYDRLYALYRKNESAYKKRKEQMLEEGKTERQIEDGFEIARYAYLKSIGIDLHEYLLYKMAISEKYADKNNSGGVSKAEKRAVVDNMDVDEETRQLIRKVLLKNNF